MIVSKVTPEDIIILGVRVDDFTEKQALNHIKTFLKTQECAIVFTPNPEICLKAEADTEYRNILNKSDLNIPDGFGLKLGAEILGQTIKNKVTGVDLTKSILSWANSQQLPPSIFILNKQGSLSSLSLIRTTLQKKFPKLKVDGLEITKQTPAKEILNALQKSEPGIVFTTLGAPHQEALLLALKENQAPVSVALAVGGTFDFITGKVKRAPKWWQDLGMEWFYRLLKQPKRIGRITDATIKFPLTCNKWKNRIKSTYRQNVMAIITQKDKFLIQNNRRVESDHWQFPQGGIDRGESASDAAIREASEELGSNQSNFSIIKELPITHKYEWPKWAQLLRGYKGQEQQFYLLGFSGKNSDFDFSSSDEVEAIKWIEKKQLLKFINKRRQSSLKKILPHL